ncbi:MAG: hypothetical protein COA78_30725 [Blastopirellula sp.]|nr:MAG: hypothetical protein COA78_30725 [Blastopirellula sp.]
MREILFQYESVNPTTWAYLSSLLMIGLFFKFNRLWSVRNLDLLLIILLAPGMLMVYFGSRNAAEQAVLNAPTVIEIEGENPIPVEPERSITEELGGSDLKEGPNGVNLKQVVPLEGPEANADGVEPEADESLALATGEAENTVAISDTLEKTGYVWLFIVSALWIIRLLIDPTMVRRPLLEPNLTTGGMAFISCAMFLFLMSNIIVSRPSAADLRGMREIEKMRTAETSEEVEEILKHYGPGYALFLYLPRLPTTQFAQPEASAEREEDRIIVGTAKTMAILTNLALVVGLALIGYRHFDNVKMGIGAGMLYQMLPYTALYAGRIDHALPAALLIWAVLCYRRPFWAGIFLGLAIGTVYYPLFLLPLWVSFYWQRGVSRFTMGIAAMLVLLALSLAITAPDFNSFIQQLRAMFGLWMPRNERFTGFWSFYFSSNAFRVPILTLFVAFSGGLALWPAQKNLGTLLSCSAAVMLGAQFWHANDGATFLAWYVPLMLLTIFRPNLEDRVALHVIGEGWKPRTKRSPETSEKKAA